VPLIVSEQFASKLEGISRAHAPGAEAEIDFDEFWIKVADDLVKCWMFVIGCPARGERSTSCSPPRSREAFLQGHVLAYSGLAVAGTKVGCSPGELTAPQPMRRPVWTCAGRYRDHSWELWDREVARGGLPSSRSARTRGAGVAVEVEGRQRGPVARADGYETKAGAMKGGEAGRGERCRGRGVADSGPAAGRKRWTKSAITNT
jgi:hypothetical protein